jgi:FKBP-type peptidyl-prolyl cis-trans isomerase
MASASTDWEDLSGDGGALKRVLRAPASGAARCADAKRVKLSYEGRVEGGDIFDSSSGYGVWMQPDKLVRGFSMGLLTCALGERAELRLTPAYAYGEKPEDPLAAEILIFTIEVLELEAKAAGGSGKPGESAAAAARQAADEARVRREEEQAAVQARKAAAAERAAALSAKKGGGGGKPGGKSKK